MARSARLLHALPLIAAALWVAALAWASTRINPWGPFGDGFRFYGLDAPAALPWVLAGLGAAGLVASAAKRHLAFAYAAVAPVAVLAGGAKQLASVALVDLLVFAALVLCTLEFLTVRARFEGVVASGANLSRQEQAPLLSFLVRYAAALAVTVAALGAALWVLINLVSPWLAARFSTRLADSIELESAIGITLFVCLALLMAVFVRVLVDGVRERRVQAPEAQHDISDLRPISREANP
jgi:hypothetical protein